MMYMTPCHGAETTMYQMSLVHNPDHGQVLEYHRELLAKAEQARLAQAAMITRKGERPASLALGFLRRLFPQYKPRSFAKTVSRPSVHT
jgi:hypothetical protein